MPESAAVALLHSGSSKRKDWTTMRRLWPFLRRKYWRKDGAAEQIGTS